MRWIVGTSLNYRFLVVAIGALLMVFGVATLPSTRVDAFPEFAPPRVVIQTACLGLSTSDVEQLVTVPLEQALNGVEGLEDMRSKSVPQLSAIELIFKQGFDELKARQLVQERMTAMAATLPTWAAPPVMLAPVSATGRAVQIGMTSKNHSVIQMSMTAYWTIRARLLEVPGVANVALWGERLQMMQVQVEPPKMEAQHVALNEVMEATADAVDRACSASPAVRSSVLAAWSTRRTSGSLCAMCCPSSPPMILPRFRCTWKVAAKTPRSAMWRVSWKIISR